MSDDELRIAVAMGAGGALCGYGRSIVEDREVPLIAWPNVDAPCWCPDYPHDLNAMHEAEKTLTYDERAAYASALYWLIPGADCAIATGSLDHDFDGYFGLLNATARQRAEAFVKVKGTK